ncbi:MAG: ABC transporter permease [Oscillospiraceae bacterium]|nr:ABC transporter permease [Oscillospiraceae bacterium]
MKKLLRNNAVQSLIASLLCILMGLLIGYIVLLFINPAGASNAILDVLKNFMKTSNPQRQARLLGATLVRTAPLLMCGLSVLFAYKVGLFNIGAAGQYVAGVCASLYAALAWGWGWLPCILFAIVAGALLGAIVGFLKAYRNVNEVISGIMLNWIALYTSNMILSLQKQEASHYTLKLKDFAPQAILPTAGLDKLFSYDKVSIAIPLAVILAIIVHVVLNRTRFGYELRATGNNKNAAKYAGMAEKRNIILTLIISGGLAGIGGAMLYLTDIEQWSVTATSVPGMGFNGIAATFLGGLNPIGTIFSSFFIQHITDGGPNVDTNLYCAQISDLITAIIIYLCGFVLFLKTAMNRAIAKSEEKQAQKAKALAAEKGGEK